MRFISVFIAIAILYLFWNNINDGGSIALW